MAIAVTINGTSRTTKVEVNSVKIHMALGSDWSCDLIFRDTDSTSSAIRPALGETVSITDGGTTVFSGRISSVEDRPIANNAKGTLTAITARSYSSVVDQVLVNSTYAAGSSLKTVVTDLRTTYLNAYGITMDASMSTGATLEEQVFEDVSMRDVLNHLSTITGWLWRITPSNELQFFSAGTKVPTYTSLTAANNLSDGPVTWQKTRTKYVNSVTLRYGTETQIPKTQTITGNGVASEWALDYASARNSDDYILSDGYVTENGVFSPLGPYGGSTVWQFHNAGGLNNLSRSSGALGNGIVATFRYAAQFPQTVTVSDSAGIAANGTYEGLFEAPDIFDLDAATELANGLLRRYLTEPKYVRLKTRQSFAMPGDQLTLTFSNRTVTGSHIITEITGTTIGKGLFQYELTCLSGDERQETWTEQLQAMLGAGGARAAGGTITGSIIPNSSGHFDGAVTSFTGFNTTTDGYEGQLTTYANSAGEGPAVILGRSDLDYRWAIVADADHGATPGTVPRLRFHPAYAGSSYSAAFYVDTDLSDNYVLLPGEGLTAVGGFYLGDYAGVISGVSPDDVITGIKTTDIMAVNGVYERSRTKRMGEWTTPSFNSANYTASSGNWTVDSGDVTTLAYTLVGKMIVVAFEINNTDVSATPTNLNIAIPGGFTAAKRMRNWAQVSDAGGAFQTGVCVVDTGGTNIAVYKDATGTATYTTTSGDNTSVHGQITFEVQ